MEKIKLYISIVLCLCIGVIRADSYEKLILKDGSVLEGHISVQRPGKDVVFVAEKAMVYIPVDKVSSIVNNEMDLNSLSSEWKEWAEANRPSVRMVGNKEYLTLSDIVLSTVETKLPDTVAVNVDSDTVLTETFMPRSINWNVVPRKVRILEKGAVVKYLDFSPNSYCLNWNDIQTIKREKRAETDLTGLIDVIELRSGEKYEGQIIEQIPGKLIRLLKDDGVVEAVNTKQIALQKKMKLNPNLDLFAQSPLLDVIRAKKGEELTGILIEQNYGTGKESGYLLVQDERGDIKRMDSSNVLETRKEKNIKYVPLTDIILKKNEIWINRKKAEETFAEELGSIMVVAPGGPSTVLKADSINGKLIVELQDNQSNRGIILLQLVQMEIKGKGLCNVFTYEDLVTRGIHPSDISVSVNKTLKQVYPVTKGNYILYKPQEKKVIFCRVVE